MTKETEVLTEMQKLMNSIINTEVSIEDQIKVRFEIDASNIEEIKKDCILNKFPLLEEYDFTSDSKNPNLDISLRLKNPARPYQEQALSIMFNNNRARSGIIVLPCGAGKTLVGIMVTATIKKSTVVLCNSGVSVEQWYREYQEWTTSMNVKSNVPIVRYTSKVKDNMFNPEEQAGILVTTYTMLGFSGQRNEEVSKVMDVIKGAEWGLMILDEVQVVPAEIFRTTTTVVKSHCKLGLTATLVREDTRIEDLNFLIGPKHYEANWLDLEALGYLARVNCIEIWAEMTKSFFEEYVKAPMRKKQLLYVANPVKYFTCKQLVEMHEKRGDKIIIFSDNLFCLMKYAKLLNKPFISGSVGERERLQILKMFKFTNQYNTILMSKVGDTSLDLPNANVIIQISSHFGSRRQEAQRLGRILRPKALKTEEFNAFFYSIISRDTEEMFFANKRRQFLVDQGYCFNTVLDVKELGIAGIDKKGSEFKELELDLLEEIRDVHKVEVDYVSSDEDLIDEENDMFKREGYRYKDEGSEMFDN